MAPGGKPLRHIRLHGQNEHHRERRAADGEKERGKAPGAHEGYNEKAHEENERRAEIAHERQRAHAYGGECDKQDKVAPPEQTVERRRARVDVSDLDKFRGLERLPGDAQPVFRAPDRFAQQQIERKKAERGKCHRPAHRAHPVQIAQPHAERKKERERCEKQKALPSHALRCGGSGDGKADAREEKRDRLRLKSAHGNAAHHKIAEPFHGNEQSKREHDVGERRAVRREEKLEEQHELEAYEQKKRHSRLHLVPGQGALALQGGALRVVQREKVQLHFAELDRVPAMERRVTRDGLAVQPDALSPVERGERPLARAGALNGGVAALDPLAGEHDIRGLRPAENALPMLDRARRAVRQLQIAPYLRHIPFAQHRARAACHDPNSEKREHVPGVL